jgi:hypothetical protein
VAAALAGGREQRRDVHGQAIGAQPGLDWLMVNLLILAIPAIVAGPLGRCGGGGTC